MLACVVIELICFESILRFSIHIVVVISHTILYGTAQFVFVWYYVVYGYER